MWKRRRPWCSNLWRIDPQKEYKSTLPIDRLQDPMPLRENQPILGNLTTIRCTIIKFCRNRSPECLGSPPVDNNPKLKTLKDHKTTFTQASTRSKDRMKNLLTVWPPQSKTSIKIGLSIGYSSFYRNQRNKKCKKRSKYMRPPFIRGSIGIIWKSN